ncbi:PREDICTED: ubiquitin carboxyl-terminal hydrolase 47-like [Amphimedon queenslandica]|uniref:Ubiquitin carboxyl-terminal hydrolase 47 C-terminal domain-containing protein n=1 Tax=Amphimedon queenslandica TaxID=400682 RepID=A0AAN0J7Z4_AMPQE|nr:PREDICTED: ubiquitin carboxyl-terminal hydrolase 47-like [Amphimedon queenslandica]|eukprot:XP_019853150.1 PREDICTED: ubiquitin carboxyl-terminal hydrolase 47-like [Amphimedon queenslandica]
MSEKESLYVQSDTESFKEVEEEPLYEELTVLSSQFNEIKDENNEMSEKLSKIKSDISRSFSSNTDSAASKLRRGMALEIEDYKFHLKAMKSPDYQPLVDNEKTIEELRERITLKNMELINEREHNEKMINDIKDLKEAEDKKQREKQKMKKEMCKFRLFCYHPVTGELMNLSLEVHEDDLLPLVLDKAYELMKLAPHFPIDRCRLVKYNYFDGVMNQSLDLNKFQHQTIGRLTGRARYSPSFALFLETRKENEIFKKYSDGGISLMISVVDLSTGKIGPDKPMRGERGWTVGKLKQHIGDFLYLNSSCMRLVMEVIAFQGVAVYELSDAKSILGMVLRGNRLYVSSNPKDYKKEYNDSLMYKFIAFHFTSIRLSITIPPGPEPTLTTTNKRGEIIMKIISVNKEIKGNGRRMQVEVDSRITLAQLKEELVPLMGAPPSGFIVYKFVMNREFEMEGLNKTLQDADINSGFELIVRLGRALKNEECRIKLYLLQVNEAVFINYMMELIISENTPVREFKKQIIKEAKAQGLDCILELDKMRLCEKIGASPDTIYLDHQLINASNDMYVTQLKGPEKKLHEWQIQVYVIRWRPSQCSVDPMEDIVLDDDYIASHIIEKLSELSGISKKYISHSAPLPFFFDMSYLDIESKASWYSVKSTTQPPLRLYHGYDGYVMYYKDSREKMKELTDKERSEIQEAEEARYSIILVFTILDAQ